MVSMFTQDDKCGDPPQGTHYIYSVKDGEELTMVYL